MNINKADTHVSDISEVKKRALEEIIKHFKCKEDVALFETVKGHIATLEVAEYLRHEVGESARLVGRDILFLSGLVEGNILRWINVHRDRVILGI